MVESLFFADCLLLLTIPFKKGIGLKLFAVFGGIFRFLRGTRSKFKGIDSTLFTLVVAFGRILLFADCLLLLTIPFEKVLIRIFLQSLVESFAFCTKIMNFFTRFSHCSPVLDS